MENYLELFRSKIRPVTEEDRKKLPRVSYSRLDMLKQCRLKFYFHYVQEITSDKSAIALDVGTFIHEVLEDKGKQLISNKTDGQPMRTAEEQQRLFSDKYAALKKDWWEDWGKPDKDGRTYDEKIDTFWNNYSSMLLDDDWYVYDVEREFEFVWEDRVRLYGFADVVMMNKDGEIKIIDHKTAREVYPDRDTKYAQQMFVYALASVYWFDKLPAEFEYHFCFLNANKAALTGKNWEDKCMTELNERIDLMYDLERTKNYYPKPMQLCHWCEYCATNPSADKKTKNTCQNYSLWTRENKTFSVNRPYDKETFNVELEYGSKDNRSSTRRRLEW